MNQDNKVSLVRLRHCNYHLASYEPLKEQLAGPMRKLEKKDKVFEFPEVIFKVAEAIAARDIDPQTLKRKDIVAWANFAVLDGPDPGVPSTIEVNTKPVEAEVKAIEVVNEPLAPKGTGLETMPIRFAIATLLISALELATTFDRHTNRDDDLKALEAVTKRYHPNVVLEKPPVPQKGQVDAWWTMPTNTRSNWNPTNLNRTYSSRRSQCSYSCSSWTCEST